MRLPDGFVAGVEQGRGLGAVFGAQAFLFASLGVFDVESPAKLAAVDDEATFYNSDCLSESYEAVRGFGCITYTRWAANPIIASDCRVIPG